jgi:hypothetical protein
MTETTEIHSGAPAEVTRTHNKNLIFAALADAGIHRVTVDYDGSGDSGQIDSIEAWTATNEEIPLPSSRKVQLASENPDRRVDHIGLEAAVEELAGTFSTTTTAVGRTTTVPSAPSSSTSPTGPSRSNTMSVSLKSIPARMNFEGDSNGASVPSQPFLGLEMGRLALRLPAAAQLVRSYVDRQVFF